MDEIKSYPLTEIQAKKVSELNAGIEKIEQMLSKELPSDEGHILMEELESRLNYLSYTPTLKGISAAVYNWAKGKVAEELIAQKVDVKEVMLRMIIAGKMAYYEGMYERTEKAIRSLEVSIEGLRTMISYLKGKQ